MFDLVLRNVTVRYGNVEAIRNVSLEIMAGEFVALLGPSGCGKTTTLRAIGGFVEPDEGDILIKDRRVNGVPPFRRNTGFVFQSYALFPHMTAGENVAFGLTMMKIDKREIYTRVIETLSLLRLEGFEDRYPNELSGGQQQRVALARAIVIRPDILLLDEPLGALDKKLREEMQVELKSLQKGMGTTTIFVTHDQEEALTMSDKIVVIDKGEIQQIGAPNDIYEKPKTRFVSNFIGVSNFFEGTCLERSTSFTKVKISEQKCVIAQDTSFLEGEPCWVSVRPERIDLVTERDDSYENVVAGKVINVSYLGNLIHYYVETDFGVVVKVFKQNRDDASSLENLREEMKIFLSWRSKDTLLLKP